MRKKIEDNLDVIIPFVAYILFAVIIVCACAFKSKVKVVEKGCDKAVIDISDDMMFDGFEWDGDDLIIHYKEKEHER